MPWKIVKKTYGKDPRYDAVYHISYTDTSIKFDVMCSYINDSYKWVLSCDAPAIRGVMLGVLPKVSDVQACEKAVAYIQKKVGEKQVSLANALSTISERIKRELEKSLENSHIRNLFNIFV